MAYFAYPLISVQKVGKPQGRSEVKLCPNCKIQMGIISSKPDKSFKTIPPVKARIVLYRCAKCNYSESVPEIFCPAELIQIASKSGQEKGKSSERNLK